MLRQLAADLIANPGIKSVWVNEKGEHYTFKMSDCTEVSRKKILAEAAGLPEVEEANPLQALIDQVEQLKEENGVIRNEADGFEKEAQALQSVKKENESMKANVATLQAQVEAAKLETVKAQAEVKELQKELEKTKK